MLLTPLFKSSDVTTKVPRHQGRLVQVYRNNYVQVPFLPPSATHMVPATVELATTLCPQPRSHGWPFSCHVTHWYHRLRNDLYCVEWDVKL